MRVAVTSVEVSERARRGLAALGAGRDGWDGSLASRQEIQEALRRGLDRELAAWEKAGVEATRDAELAAARRQFEQARLRLEEAEKAAHE